VAAKAADSKPLELALVRQSMQPASLSVRLLDHLGRPIPDATLRLIVSTIQPSESDDRQFSWYLFNSGQLAEQFYVEQFLPGTTDADGRFTFTDLVPGRYLQLLHWGKGVPKGRTLAFDETRAGQPQSLELEFSEPAVVRGSVDRSKFPNAGSVRIWTRPRSSLEFTAELKDGQETFELADLPVGRFGIALESKPVRYSENGNIYSHEETLTSEQIDLKPGELKEIRFDENSPPP
jgi:hypothetical protein